MRERVGGWPVVGGGCAAWLSHLLLDSFYCYGRGVPVAWPVSDYRLELSMPWFENMDPAHFWSLHNLKVGAVELALYGTLLALCVLIRRARSTRQSAIASRKSAIP